MPQLALAVVGAEIGATVFGAEAFSIGSLAVSGAQAGFVAGSVAGSVLFAPTQKTSGPRLADLRAPQLTYGSVIPYVEGHQRLPGIPIWMSEAIEIETTTNQGGKGGGGVEATTSTYKRHVLFVVSENMCGAMLKVFKNGELVWTSGTDASTDSISASGQQELWDDIRFYSGAVDQMPDPIYEAAVGVGSAPAYRGYCTVMIEGLSEGNSGTLPLIEFVVVQGATGPASPPKFEAPLATHVHDVASPIATDSTTNPSGLSFSGGWAQFSGSANATVEYTAAKLKGGSHLKDFDLTIRNVTHAGSGGGGYQYIWELVEAGASAKFGFILEVTSSSTYQPPQDAVHDYLIVGASFGSGIEAATAGANAEIDYRTIVQGLPFTRPFDITFDPMTNLATYRYGNGSGIVSENTFTISVSTTSGAALKMACNVDGVDTTLAVYGGQNDIRITLGDGGDGVLKFYADDELIHTGTTTATTGFGTMRLHGFGAGGATGINSWQGQELIAYLGLAGSVALVEPTLEDVVKRQCTRGGLDLAKVDASALSGITVRGMALTQPMSPRAVIDMLAQAYLFTAVESDVLRFTLRGGAPVATIPYDDLVRLGDGEALPIVMANDLELPVQVFVKFADAIDDYQDGAESSDRLVSKGQNTVAVEFPLALIPREGKHIADVQVMDAAASKIRFGPFALTRDYARLEPTDVVILTDWAGNEFRTRLTKKSEAGGVLTFEAVLDNASVISSAAVTDASGYHTSTVVRPPIDTDVQLLDIPILRDADDDPGFYAVAKPATDVSFPGAMLLKSADDVTFEPAARLSNAGVFGVTTTVLGAGRVGLFDEANSVTVDIGATGELAGVTRDVLLNGRTNAFLIGSEIVQARSASLISAGVYKLTGLLRGLRGTEWAVDQHEAGERVVLLDSALARVTLDTREIGVEEHWKAVTMGRSASSAASAAFTDNGVGQKPFAPVDMRIGRDTSANITMTLQRRTRMSTRLIGPHGISCPLGEESERYSLDVYSDNTRATVVRTLTATSPSFSYTAAQQTTDFGSAQATIYIAAFQLSATLGRGTAAFAQG
jgi:hypothetical protein